MAEKLLCEGSVLRPGTRHIPKPPSRVCVSRLGSLEVPLHVSPGPRRVAHRDIEGHLQPGRCFTTNQAASGSLPDHPHARGSGSALRQNHRVRRGGGDQVVQKRGNLSTPSRLFLTRLSSNSRRLSMRLHFVRDGSTSWRTRRLRQRFGTCSSRFTG